MSRHIATSDYPRFHLAFPVTDLARARAFYGGYLGGAEGRSSEDWVDFDFFGHQIVAHKVAAAQAFVIERHIRFRREPGEQATMLFLDPFGNALQFKAFADSDRLFAK